MNALGRYLEKVVMNGRERLVRLSIAWNHSRMRKELKAVPWASIIVVAGLVAAAWYAFLSLVQVRPVSDSSALVMIWVSILLLLLAFFPSILRRIRKVRFRDWELELVQEVERATDRTPLLVVADQQFVFAEKGGFGDLASLLRRAASDRTRPVILDVDVGRGNRISISMLHLYVALLDLAHNPVIVVFRSDEPSGEQGISRLKGVIEGRRLAFVLRREFPYVWRLFNEGLPIQQLAEGWPDPGPAFAGVALMNDQRLTAKIFLKQILPELTQAWVFKVDGRVSADRIKNWLRTSDVERLVLMEDDTPVGLINLCALARRMSIEVSRGDEI